MMHIPYLMRLKPRLKPLARIERAAGKDRWLATADDPCLRMGFRPRAGWFWLTVRIYRPDGRRPAPKLYVDVGAGASEDDAVQLGGDRTGWCKRVLWLPARPRQLRLDPDDRSGEVAVEGLSLRRIPSWSARGRMRAKLHRRGLCSPGDDASLRRTYEGCFRQVQGVDYADWIAAEERPMRPVEGPAISLVIPTWNADPALFAALIDSILAQAYRSWLLVVVDDASTSGASRAAVEAQCARDPRIRLVRRERNGGIAAATNDGIAGASGEWIAFVDHDDELPPWALSAVMAASSSRPEVGLIYTDEDKIRDGRDRHEPHLKPDPDPYLLLSCNYVCHLLTVRRSALAVVGGLDPALDGAQDHDLVLRLVEHLGVERCLHVPQVCYHWRRSAGSTADSAEAKPAAWRATLAAVERALERRGERGACVEPGPLPFTTRIRWPLPDPVPLVSVIVPTRDGSEVLARCLRGVLAETSYPAVELLLVDNQSADARTIAVLAEAAKDPRVRLVLYDHPFNYAALTNWAVAQARGAVVCLLNDDTEVLHPEWLAEMVCLAVRPDVGAVGAKLLYPDGTVQHAGVVLGFGGVANHAHRAIPGDHPGYFGRAKLLQGFSAVTAACLVLRRALYDEVGGMDAGRLAVAFNDVDLCLKLQAAGYRNLFTPWACLVHHESKTRGADDEGPKLERFRAEARWMAERWAERLAADPHYHPRLARRGETFALG